MKLLSLLAFSTLLFSTQAIAFSHADGATIEAALQRYGAAIEAERYSDIAELTPPRIIEGFERKTGVPAATIRSQIISRAEELSEGRDVLNVTFDTEAIQFETNAFGFKYSFIPTTTVSKVALGETITVETQTFAVEEGGKWFFLNLNDTSDFDMIRAVYPGFLGVKVPATKDTP